MVFVALRSVFIILLILVSVILGVSIFLDRPSNLMRVSFLDVGQGDSILVEVPNGNQLLVDAGVDSRVLHQLGKSMRWFDRSIDFAIATHADEDHIGGFPAIFEVYKIGKFVIQSTDRNDELLKILQEKEVLFGEELYQGDRLILDFDREIFVDVFWPPKGEEFSNRNDGSYALKISYGEVEFFLTGDLPESVEEKLVSLYGEKISSDILKAGHHGSKTSSSEIFLSTVKPKYGIISAGKENRYGHPSQEVLDRFSNLNIEIFRTDQEGSVVFETDGFEIWKK